MHFMKFLYLVIIISILFAHGNDDHKHDRGKPSGCAIYGTILDSITNKPMEYVSISVIESNGSIITGGITDTNGKFKIDKIRPGEYNVKIEFMGFSPILIEDINLSFRGKQGFLQGFLKVLMYLPPQN